MVFNVLTAMDHYTPWIINVPFNGVSWLMIIEMVDFPLLWITRRVYMITYLATHEKIDTWTPTI